MSEPVITIPSEHYVTRLSADVQPLAAVDPGETVHFQTSDHSYRQVSGNDIDSNAVDFREANRLTGPVFVRSAEPGDALGFHIERIEITTDAHMLYVAPWQSQSFGLSRSETGHFPVSGNTIPVGDGIAIPMQPMIGCIATAPKDGILHSLSPCRSTGGNLDLPDLRDGTTVWFPVRVPGGLFALGDLHAAMGRGEPVGCGLECGGIVTGRFHVRKGRSLPGVRFESDHAIGFVGSHATDMRVAQQRAVRAAWTWLTGDCLVEQSVALAVCAALLDVDMGGPAGANWVATFDLELLRKSGITPQLLRSR